MKGLTAPYLRRKTVEPCIEPEVGLVAKLVGTDRAPGVTEVSTTG
jgi:hypothetical protein